MSKDRVVPIPKPTFSHAELADRVFEDVVWGINGLVPQGVSILAAKPKIGKSWLALQMCWAVAAGRELWDGREPEKQGTALYLALEDNQRRLQTRSKKQFPQSMIRDDQGATNWQAQPLSNLHFATEWPRIGQGGIKRLNSWLNKHPDCALIAIDTLARIRAARSGSNFYEDDYKVGEQLKRVADAHEVAIMLIHHTRKMEAEDPFDTISGSQGLAGSVDASLVLTRLRGHTEAGLFITGRDIEDEVELAIQFDKNECRWNSSGITVQEAKMDESRRAVLDIVRKSDVPLTIKQIRGKLSEDGITKSPEAIRKTVQRMFKQEQLEKVDGNKYQSHVSQYG